MSRWVIFGVWVWFVGVLLSSFMTGTFIGTTQQGVLDKLQIFGLWRIAGFTIPVINFQFFDGLWSIMQPGNFEFLSGNPLFIIVYLLNIGIVVGFLMFAFGLVTSFIKR